MRHTCVHTMTLMEKKIREMFTNYLSYSNQDFSINAHTKDYYNQHLLEVNG